MHEEKDLVAIRFHFNTLSSEQLLLLPFYHDVRNEIIDPRKFVQETRYFWRKCKSRLGPLNTVLVMELRDRCYYNPRTGEKRDHCYPSLDELARSIGVSKATIKRALADERVRPFVRTEPKYRVDPKINKKVRSSNIYHVAMDDPLLPDDETVLMDKLFKRFCRDGFVPKEQKERSFPPPEAPRSPRAQNEPQVHSSRAQNELHIYEAQNEPVRNTVRRSTLNNVNVEKNLLMDRKEIETRVSLLVKDMLEVLKDPSSRNFYRLAARRILESQGSEELIYRALSETKQEALAGNIKKSKGACFTYILKRYCKEYGVSLSREVVR